MTKPTPLLDWIERQFIKHEAQFFCLEHNKTKDLYRTTTRRYSSLIYLEHAIFLAGTAKWTNWQAERPPIPPFIRRKPRSLLGLIERELGLD